MPTFTPFNNLVSMTKHIILPVQSVSVTSKAVSSNPAYGDVDSIPHYVIKFFSDSLQVGGFLVVLRFPPRIILTAVI
jgi:hypothetical protein